MPENIRHLKVFLCHTSADKPAVRDLYRQLEKDGVDAWLDSEDLIPGQNWQIEIPAAVQDSDVVLICLSENSVNKEGYVQKEITFALDRAQEMPEGRIFLIPVRLEDCRVPQRLGSFQWVDLFSENGYERLMLALKLRAEQIGTELLGRRSFFSRKVTKPVMVKSKQDPTPAAPTKEKISQDTKVKKLNSSPKATKKPFKLRTGYIFVMIGAVATIIAAIIGSPLIKSLLSQAPEPKVTATFPIQVSPTETITSAPIPFPSGITDPKGVEMVLVPEGVFMMGSGIESAMSDEKPAHQVYLDDYYIDKYEVTYALYKVCVEEGYCDQPASASRYDISKYMGHPVVYVDWNMAMSYCSWRDARLPTEAEWEKAARGTDGRLYPWGSGIDTTSANYGNNLGDTKPIGTYPIDVSPYGVYDMAGNVAEWVADWYDENYYANSPDHNPLGPEDGDARVVRGASWHSSERLLRSASRSWYFSTHSGTDIGFRCANSP